MLVVSTNMISLSSAMSLASASIAFVLAISSTSMKWPPPCRPSTPWTSRSMQERWHPFSCWMSWPCVPLAYGKEWSCRRPHLLCPR
jgi:hypothetical protein